MDPLAETRAQTAAVRSALDRHQQRREQGIPTLGVLIGPPEAAEAAWRDWAAATGRTPVQFASWPAQEAGASDPGPPAQGAILYVHPPPASGAEERPRCLSRALDRLSRRLDMAAPAGTTAHAISVLPADATAYLRDEAHTRAGALFIEGMITLPGELLAPAPDQPPTGPAAGTLALLTRLGASPATAARFRAAEEEQSGDEPGDRARSAAERFLCDLLGDLPDTVGLFELNVRLGFCFGPMPAEVDLLAASLRLAVEIDGYHHFRDLENYRRDRRKDALLQKQGYLVLRFLAGDVVTRLEDIVEEIRAAVAFRRATRR